MIDEETKQLIKKLCNDDKDKVLINLQFFYENKDSSFISILEKFLSLIPQQEVAGFLELVKKIKSFDLLQKFERSIINYNFQDEFQTNTKNDGIRFLLLCVAIESFYNFDEDNAEKNVKTFERFFKSISEPSKRIIFEKFEIVNGRNYDKNKVIEKFPRYIYEKRSIFVHQGIQFALNDNDGITATYDVFKEQKLPIRLTLTLTDFLKIFEDGLFQNLKKEIEEPQF